MDRIYLCGGLPASAVATPCLIIFNYSYILCLPTTIIIGSTANSNSDILYSFISSIWNRTRSWQQQKCTAGWTWTGASGDITMAVGCLKMFRRVENSKRIIIIDWLWHLIRCAEFNIISGMLWSLEGDMMMGMEMVEQWNSPLCDYYYYVTE